MRPLRLLAEGIRLFRPWLAIEKAEVLAYLNDRGLSYRTDSSNLDQGFTRNRIRQDLLPKLQAEYNGRIHDALAGLARHAAHASRLLDARARRALEKAERPRVESLLVFDTEALRQLPLEALQSLYAYVWRREGWPRGNMGRSEWESLARWTQGPSAALDLPDGIRAVKKRSVVQLGPRK
jgi:tRNA(Ile)-lysidine synthase